MLIIAQEKNKIKTTQSIQSEEIIWSNLEFYIIQFNDAEKCQSVLVENLSFIIKNKTLKVVLQGHRAGFLICCTEAQDKGRFTYVQWKFTCSESVLKCSESLQVPVRPCFTAPSFYRNRWQQRPRTSSSKRREWDETLCQGLDEKKNLIKKISHWLSANLFRHFLGHSEGQSNHCAASGAVTGALGPLPNTTGEEQHVLQKTLAQEAQELLQVASLNLAFYFPLPLNFISKTKAIIFPTLPS